MNGTGRFRFFDGPWENAQEPTLVMTNPTGGDPLILARLRVHRPHDIYDLCELANSHADGFHAFITHIAALKISGASMSGDDAVSALSGLVEEARALIRQANGEAAGAPQSSTQGN